LKEHDILARNPEAEIDAKLTVGQHMADHIAAFGGSWWFISVFAVVLFGWMALNSWVLVTNPTPSYILLNW
jgi:uncharacterized membrane protein